MFPKWQGLDPSSQWNWFCDLWLALKIRIKYMKVHKMSAYSNSANKCYFMNKHFSYSYIGI